MNYVALLGNVVDGLRIVGPFEFMDDALTWCEENVPDEWVIAQVEDPS